MGDHTVGMTATAMISPDLFAGERRGRVTWFDLIAPKGSYTIGFDVNVALMWDCR